VQDQENKLIIQYQKMAQKKLDELYKKLITSKQKIESSLTNDELEVIQNFLLNDQTERETTLKLVENLFNSLIDIDQNSYYIYDELCKRIETLEKQEKVLEDQFNIKQEKVEEVNEGKDKVKKEVEDIQQEATKLASIENNLSIMSAILDEKISFQQKRGQIEIMFYKQQKLLTALLTFSILQGSSQKEKGIIPKLAISYLTAKALQNLLFPSQEKQTDVSEVFVKEISDLLDDTKNLQEKLTKNIKQIEQIEQEVESKYKEYLELQTFQDLLYMIKKLITNLKTKEESTKKTKEKLENMKQKSIRKTKEVK